MGTFSLNITPEELAKVIKPVNIYVKVKVAKGYVKVTSLRIKAPVVETEFLHKQNRRKKRDKTNDSE